MTRGLLFAKCMLTALGIFVLNQGLQCLHIPSDIHMSGWAWSVSLIVVIVFCGYLIFKFAFDNAEWARRLAGNSEGPVISDKWIAAGFRLILVFSGLLILVLETRFIARSIAFLIVAPKLIVEMVVYRYVDEAFVMSITEWLKLFAKLCTNALGIYLVIGAPHYIRCQMKLSPQIPAGHAKASKDA